MKDFRKIYKALARTKHVSKYHVAQYAILKSMEIYDPVIHGVGAEVLADKFIRRAFTPITNKRKLDNGRDPMDTVYRTLDSLFTSKTILELENSELLGDLEIRKYYDIIGALKKKYGFFKSKEVTQRYYVYTFVRQDISPEYQLVQAAHATARMGHRLGRIVTWTDDVFDELYFAVIGVANDQEMATAIKDCKEVGLTTYCFYEPDIGDVLTAFSTSPVRADQRKRLLSYKKLRFS